MYTITFNRLKELGYDPFPIFDFPTVKILDKDVSKEDLISAFYSYYGNYQIAFSNPNKFIFEFQRIFNRNYLILLKQIEVANKIVYDFSGYKRDIERTSNYDSKYSDTPNETLANGDSYLTNITNDTDNANTVENYQQNNVEKFNEINSKIRNVIYDFLDKFNNLFLFYNSTKTYHKYRRI